MPGSGKSTVGKALKENHGWFFVDSDEEIERRTSRSTTNIIREDGEKAFRAIESNIIQELVCDLVNSSASNRFTAGFVVISLGGGAVTTKEVLDLLLSQTVMVYLDVGFEEQLERLKGDKQRPLIAADALESFEEKLRRLKKERSKFYESAKYRVKCENKTVREIAEEVVELITKKA